MAKKSSRGSNPPVSTKKSFLTINERLILMTLISQDLYWRLLKNSVSSADDALIDLRAKLEKSGGWK